MNTIVIAALALIVLVVLVLIFTGNIGGFGKGTEEATKTCIGLNSDPVEGKEHSFKCMEKCDGSKGWFLKSGDYPDCSIISKKCCRKADYFDEE